MPVRAQSLERSGTKNVDVCTIARVQMPRIPMYARLPDVGCHYFRCMHDYPSENAINSDVCTKFDGEIVHRSTLVAASEVQSCTEGNCWHRRKWDAKNVDACTINPGCSPLSPLSGGLNPAPTCAHLYRGLSPFCVLSVMMPPHNAKAAALAALFSSWRPSARDITEEAPAPNKFASAVRIIIGGKHTPIAATSRGRPAAQ